MNSSKQLYGRLRDIQNKMDAAAGAGNDDEALRLDGEYRVVNEWLNASFEEEEAERERPMLNSISEAPKSIGEQVFGARDSFEEIKPGFKGRAAIKNDSETPPPPAVNGLGTPQIYRTGLMAPVAAPMGFLSTIPHDSADGDEHYFQAPALTNNAAGWATGEKPGSILTWNEAVAHLEVIAHWIPIKKQTAARYAQLESVVSGALMTGLDIAADKMALHGSNSNGIVGVTNVSGILEHTAVATDNLKDTLMAMRRKARVASGIAPTHVALSPYAIECLSKAKDTDGRYLFGDFANGDTIAGMTVVEDVNMTLTDGTETALVYWAGAMSFGVADGEEVTVGLTNSQFIKNEYTLLAEMTALLRVYTPAAICYCADLGINETTDAGKQQEIGQ